LKKEGSELFEKIGQLQIKASDGKFYKTDVADTEQLFRIIESIPSPKADPFKLWREELSTLAKPTGRGEIGGISAFFLRNLLK